MANSMFRVNIPKNAKELLDLAATIFKKHTDLGSTSPLNAMVSHNWSDNGSKIAVCLEKHQLAETLAKQAEEAYRDRDLLLSEITESVKASRDILIGVYRETPKTLGEFGFEVNDTARVTKKKE